MTPNEIAVMRREAKALLRASLWRLTPDQRAAVAEANAARDETRNREVANL
jgi:hypothetical protein